MPKSFAFADLYPKDPRAPFANPTEEPDYSPDYRMIAPELDTPQSYLPLIPSPNEATRIRRFFSLTFLTLIFGFLAAMTVHTALRLLISVILQQVDLRAVGELPQNYSSIRSLYFNDSSLSYAVTLISFLIGNLAALLVGCKLTGVRMRDCFRTRSLRAANLISYVLLGLWIQLVTGHLAQWVQILMKQLGVRSFAPQITVSGPLHRTAVLALYCCVVAPVTEELLMRGLVLKNLCRVSQRLGIVLSALLFAIMHENVPQMLLAFPLGVLLAYITIRHNSVTPAICVHICVNTVEFLMQLGNEYLPTRTFSTVNMVYTLGILLIGAVIFSLTLLTERLPVPTPHQSMRGWRIVCSSPIFWLLLVIHGGAALYQAGLLTIPNLF